MSNNLKCWETVFLIFNLTIIFCLSDTCNGMSLRPTQAFMLDESEGTQVRPLEAVCSENVDMPESRAEAARGLWTAVEGQVASTCARVRLPTFDS